MDKHDIDEVIGCLTQQRTLFRYCKDAYVIHLLERTIGDGASLTALRQGPFARLLDKPSVKALLAACGDNRLDPHRLTALWREPSLPFLLTVGAWGGAHRDWQQTSRPGWNLVLRLNFTSHHDRRFRTLFEPEHPHRHLNYGAHPILRRNERPYYRETLAWARIDLDFATGQALIEEIQSDWIAEAQRERRWLARLIERQPRRRAALRNKIEYLERVLAPYAKLWDEAMLAAALRFITDELGFQDIWYHDWRCGMALKRIDPDQGPPRSLYTDTPRRFCFQSTRGMPAMLDTAKRRSALRRAGVEPRFQRLRMAA